MPAPPPPPSGFASYRFVDWATQGYVAAVGVLVLALHVAPGRHGFLWLAAAHLAALVVTHLLIVHGSRGSAPTPIRFVRDFYPILLYTGLYRETEFVNAMIGTPRLDPFLIRLEHALFGLQPSVEFMAAVPSPVVSEFLYAFYFSYYLMIAGIGFWLLVTNRPAFLHFVAVVSLVFYACYAIYLFVPVVGPRLFFDPAAPERALFTELYGRVPSEVPDSLSRLPVFGVMRFIYRHFEAWSAAFPSSHVAISLVTAWFSWRYLPRLRWWHAAAAVFLCVATVYGRYHYVVDVAAGIAVAATLLPLANRLHRRFDQLPGPP